jgi:hypothetical protein
VSGDALRRRVQAETIRPENSKGHRLQCKDLQFMLLKGGAQACAGAPKRQLVFHTDHYTTAVSPGQGVGGVLKCIFVLGAVICQTGRAYEEPLNTLLRDTQVCSKWLGFKTIHVFQWIIRNNKNCPSHVQCSCTLDSFNGAAVKIQNPALMEGF